jgi:hypothetical protein
MSRLEQGVHIMVGTPGRVFDMINHRALFTDSIKLFVLDEILVKREELTLEGRQPEQARQPVGRRALRSPDQLRRNSREQVDPKPAFQVVLRDRSRHHFNATVLVKVIERVALTKLHNFFEDEQAVNRELEHEQKTLWLEIETNAVRGIKGAICQDGEDDGVQRVCEVSARVNDSTRALVRGCQVSRTCTSNHIQ